ncbi:hypothetical protein FRB96_000690 [Tulasnella sp. 330]|nr:hypothetical protein FRB96_000690 [Tulasnella sp. 330]KAG8879779.1 hypothetical protein FRB97_001385 [Tulasnella sp. 331]
MFLRATLLNDFVISLIDSTESAVTWVRGALHDTLCGLEYLHSLDPPIVHGDLKAPNTLLKNNGRAVLCDFGLSRVGYGHSGFTTGGDLRGSKPYLSPELITLEDAGVDNPQKTEASDMWAWGSLAIEIMEGRQPYENLSEHRTRAAIGDGILPTPRDCISFVELWPILEGCWAKDPDHRMDSKKCLNHLTALFTHICGVAPLPEPAPWLHTSLEPPETKKLYMEPDEQSLDLTTDFHASIRLYNVHTEPLVYAIQRQSSSRASEFQVSPACGLVPARSFLRVKASKVDDAGSHDTSPTENNLRLLYSFVQESDVRKAPTTVWKEQAAKETVTFYHQGLVALSQQLTMVGQITWKTAEHKLAASPPQLSPTKPSVLALA